MSTSDGRTPILDAIWMAMHAAANSNEPPVAVLLNEAIRFDVLKECRPETYHPAPHESIHGLPVQWLRCGARVSLRMQKGDVRIVCP